MSGLIGGVAAVVGAGLGYALQKVLANLAASGSLQALRQKAVGAAGILQKH